MSDDIPALAVDSGAYSRGMRLSPRVAVPVLVAFALVGPATVVAPATAVPPATDAARSALPNPGGKGPFATKRSTVFRGWERVEVDLNLPVEDLAEVTVPVNARGNVPKRRFPVVLLLHGRHEACAQVGGETPDPVPAWCPDGDKIPVPSYAGYRYLADRLASQGRVVVSISANGINGQDNSRDLGATARALLIAHHLTRLAEASARSVEGYGNLLVGRLDLSRTVLMGHSRGGEGAVRAAQMLADAQDKDFAIAGVIPLAPTSFARMAPPTVPTVTILPACDGDVADLQGETYLDRGRDLYGSRGGLRSSVWVPGGNHNYFNTEWTPGLSVSETGNDDATYAFEKATGSCAASARLTPAQQRAVGIQVMAAAVRYMQEGNRSMLALLDGSGRQPRGLKGITLRAASQAGPDRLLLVPASSQRLRATRVEASLCRGISLGSASEDERVCATGVGDPQLAGTYDTAWLGSDFVDGPLPGRVAVEVSWQRPGTALVDLRRPVNLRRTSRLSARVVLDPSSTGTVRLAVRDAAGRTATLSTRGLPVRPVSKGQHELRLWAQSASVDPRRFRGVDLTRITAVGIATAGRGKAWLIEVSRRAPRPLGPAPLLPVAEVVDAVETVDAGQSVTVPVQVRLDQPAGGGLLGRNARLRFSVTAGLDPSILPAYNGTLLVAAGARRATIRVPVKMPVVVGSADASSVQVAIYAMNGATVGTFRGSLTVLPAGVRIRTITLESASAIAAPGASLEWDFVADEPGLVSVSAEVTGGTLDLEDLDPEFLEFNDLPKSGPLTGLQLLSEQVAPNRYRISLPLSVNARDEATLELAVTAVSGAKSAELPPLAGQVSCAPPAPCGEPR